MPCASQPLILSFIRLPSSKQGYCACKLQNQVHSQGACFRLTVLRHSYAGSGTYVQELLMTNFRLQCTICWSTRGTW